MQETQDQQENSIHDDNLQNMDSLTQSISNNFGDYIVQAPIGRGAGSFVVKVQSRRTKKDYAVKVIDKKSEQYKNISKRLQNEIKIHSKLDHKNIVKLVNSFEDTDNHYLMIEYCQTGDLFHYLKGQEKLQEKEARQLTKQLAEGLKYLHDNKIIHRDLKLGNILLTENHTIKICDLGLAIQLTDFEPERNTLCGTPNYLSPEIINREPYGFKIDIWSFGCILYALMTGKPPFESQSIQETLKKVTQTQKLDYPDNFSPEIKDLLNNIITWDTEQRYNINQILDHPFYNKKNKLQPQQQQIQQQQPQINHNNVSFSAKQIKYPQQQSSSNQKQQDTMQQVRKKKYSFQSSNNNSNQDQQQQQQQQQQIQKDLFYTKDQIKIHIDEKFREQIRKQKQETKQQHHDNRKYQSPQPNQQQSQQTIQQQQQDHQQIQQKMKQQQQHRASKTFSHKIYSHTQQNTNNNTHNNTQNSINISNRNSVSQLDQMNIHYQNQQQKKYHNQKKYVITSSSKPPKNNNNNNNNINTSSKSINPKQQDTSFTKDQSSTKQQIKYKTISSGFKINNNNTQQQQQQQQNSYISTDSNLNNQNTDQYTFLNTHGIQTIENLVNNQQKQCHFKSAQKPNSHHHHYARNAKTMRSVDISQNTTNNNIINNNNVLYTTNNSNNISQISNSQQQQQSSNTSRKPKNNILNAIIQKSAQKQQQQQQQHYYLNNNTNIRHSQYLNNNNGNSGNKQQNQQQQQQNYIQSQQKYMIKTEPNELDYDYRHKYSNVYNKIFNKQNNNQQQQQQNQHQNTTDTSNNTTNNNNTTNINQNISDLSHQHYGRWQQSNSKSKSNAKNSNISNTTATTSTNNIQNDSQSIEKTYQKNSQQFSNDILSTAKSFRSCMTLPTNTDDNNNILSPIKSGNIKQQKFQTKNGFIEVTQRKEIKVEACNGKLIFNVQPDGQTIHIEKKLEKGSQNKTYSLHKLPKKYYELYRYTKQVSEILLSKTVKAKLVNSDGKFILMENGHFEGKFNNGVKVAINSEKPNLIKVKTATDLNFELNLNQVENCNNLNQELLQTIKDSKQYYNAIQTKDKIEQQKQQLDTSFSNNNLQQQQQQQIQQQQQQFQTQQIDPNIFKQQSQKLNTLR